MNKEIENMKSEFGRIFGGGESFVVRAPGRVNLIGEHTDYNDGFVLPIAMDCAVYFLGRRAEGSRSRVHSLNFGDAYEFDIKDKYVDGAARGWAKYVEGTVRVLHEKVAGIKYGIDAVVWGDVPLGSGLSSSAALEVATGFFLLSANGREARLPRLARMCQEAENRYAGVQCGIMDQFASCLGKEGGAIFLDCRSLQFEYVPVMLERHSLLVMNTGVARGLAGSAYNDRRSACEQGVEIIKRVQPDVKALRDVSVDEFEYFKSLLPEDVARKCRHIVTENERVLDSVESLRKGDMESFGRHMSESHHSLRYDYEVTCRELDLLHDEAMSMPGVAGERMTGAGFGGCAVALVEKESVEEVERRISEIYKKKTGIALEIYRTEARQGVSVVEI